MKSAAVCFALLIAMQGSVFGQSNNFTCGFDSPLSLSERNDVKVTTSTSSRGLEDRDLLKGRRDVSSAESPRFAPLAGDHDLILGDCEADDFDFTYTIDMCVLPDADNGTATQQLNVEFTQSVEIGCIRILDTYNNTEGEDLGGYPFVDEGGIGFDFVKLRFESQEAQGMKFHIEIKTYMLETTTTEPTTAEPTTAEPTTAEPTTAEPTTAEPTTPETTPVPFLSGI